MCSNRKTPQRYGIAYPPLIMSHYSSNKDILLLARLNVLLPSFLPPLATDISSLSSHFSLSFHSLFLSSLRSPFITLETFSCRLRTVGQCKFRHDL